MPDIPPDRKLQELAERMAHALDVCRGYMRHGPRCTVLTQVNGPCTCGGKSARDGADRLVGEARAAGVFTPDQVGYRG